ncbi:hypothetical protein LUX39_45815 [Actinomadura madurae]|nr:hypothetical protein [Actinomadura madurae]MCQ0020144.1 hypothetical protein [Actinomadura madurae]
MDLTKPDTDTWPATAAAAEMPRRYRSGVLDVVRDAVRRWRERDEPPPVSPYGDDTPTAAAAKAAPRAESGVDAGTEGAPEAKGWAARQGSRIALGVRLAGAEWRAWVTAANVTEDELAERTAERLRAEAESRLEEERERARAAARERRRGGRTHRASRIRDEAEDLVPTAEQISATRTRIRWARGGGSAVVAVLAWQALMRMPLLLFLLLLGGLVGAWRLGRRAEAEQHQNDHQDDRQDEGQDVAEAVPTAVSERRPLPTPRPRACRSWPTTMVPATIRTRPRRPATPCLGTICSRRSRRRRAVTARPSGSASSSPRCSRITRWTPG